MGESPKGKYGWILNAYEDMAGDSSRTEAVVRQEQVSMISLAWGSDQRKTASGEQEHQRPCCCGVTKPGIGVLTRDATNGDEATLAVVLAADGVSGAGKKMEPVNTCIHYSVYG